MKKELVLLLLLFVSFSLKVRASDIPIIYSNGETFSKVLTLPDVFSFEYNERIYHADLGIKYNQLCLFWIPLFNYGEKEYVFFNERKDSYVYAELSVEDIKMLQSLYGTSAIPDDPELSFWNAWGGKLLCLAFILLGYLLLRFFSD